MISIDVKEKCCGCTACINSCPKKCIEMEKDEEGFLYPKVSKEKCINCGLCEKVCPILNKKEELQEKTLAYAVYAKADEIRNNSSSGGTFSLIANKILSQGGYVCGCAFDNDFKVEHILIDDISEIKDIRGSKYVQSDLKDSFTKIKELLEAEKKVLFSGTPCQIEGLKMFLRKPYDNLFLIDIVCHGAPSPMVWEQYKTYQEEKFSSSISYVSFRDKKYGWKDYRVKLDFNNGQTYLTRNWDDIYIKSYIKDLISRPACYECNFRKWHRESDITLGDFWGIEHALPEWNDDKGVSLVMVHSEKGSKMLNSLLEQIEIKDVTKEAAIQYNKSIILSNGKPRDREKFFKTLDKEGYSAVIKKYVNDSFRDKLKNLSKRLKR